MGGYEIADWHVPQGRILGTFWSLRCKSGSPGSFMEEVMSDLKSEGHAGNNQA